MNTNHPWYGKVGSGTKYVIYKRVQRKSILYVVVQGGQQKEIKSFSAGKTRTHEQAIVLAEKWIADYIEQRGEKIPPVKYIDRTAKIE